MSNQSGLDPYAGSTVRQLDVERVELAKANRSESKAIQTAANKAVVAPDVKGPSGAHGTRKRGS